MNAKRVAATGLVAVLLGLLFKERKTVASVASTAAGAIGKVLGQATAYVAGKATGVITLVELMGKKVELQTAKQFLAMQAAAKEDGVSLIISSGFRTMEEQTALRAKYESELAAWQAAGSPAGKKPTSAAEPGHSNHQNGIALDIYTRGNDKNSPEYQWLAENAGDYGFVNTGAGFSPPEWWHWERKSVVNV